MGAISAVADEAAHYPRCLVVNCWVTRVTPRRKGDGPGMFIAVLGEVRTFKGRDIDIRRTVPADVQRNFQAIPCIDIRPTLQNVDELAKVIFSVNGSN